MTTKRIIPPPTVDDLPKYRGEGYLSSPKLDVLFAKEFYEKDGDGNAVLVPATFKILYGGRGGAKSWGAADALVKMCSISKIRATVARENLVSIRGSSYTLIIDTINRLGLTDIWTYTNNTIVCKRTKSTIDFKGFWNQEGNIKGLEGCDIVWVEEAQQVSQKSIDELIPTIIRKIGAQIWFTMNPASPYGAVYSSFVSGVKLNRDGTEKFSPVRSGTLAIDIQYYDNPFLTKSMLDDANLMFKNDPEMYYHIWEGRPMLNSNCLVLSRANIVFDEFESPSYEDGIEFKYGLDFGTVDPNAGVRCFIENGNLFVDYEIYSCDVSNLSTGKGSLVNLITNGLPGCQRNGVHISADRSSPDVISYLKSNGLPNIRPSFKNNNSVDTGVNWFNSVKTIYIHKRCVNLYREAKSWKYKEDKMTGLPNGVFVEGNDHAWDALRYALDSVIHSQRGVKIL